MSEIDSIFKFVFVASFTTQFRCGLFIPFPVRFVHLLVHDIQAYRFYLPVVSVHIALSPTRLIHTKGVGQGRFRGRIFHIQFHQSMGGMTGHKLANMFDDATKEPFHILGIGTSSFWKIGQMASLKQGLHLSLSKGSNRAHPLIDIFSKEEHKGSIGRFLVYLWQGGQLRPIAQFFRIDLCVGIIVAARGQGRKTRLDSSLHTSSTKATRMDCIRGTWTAVSRTAATTHFLLKRGRRHFAGMMAHIDIAIDITIDIVASIAPTPPKVFQRGRTRLG